MVSIFILPLFQMFKNAMPRIGLIYIVTQFILIFIIERYLSNIYYLKYEIFDEENFILEDIRPGNAKRLEQEENKEWIWYNGNNISLVETRIEVKKIEDKIATLSKYSLYHYIFPVKSIYFF